MNKKLQIKKLCMYVIHNSSFVKSILGVCSILLLEFLCEGVGAKRVKTEDTTKP